MEVKIGDTFRDISGNRDGWTNQRTIRVVNVLPNSVLAEVLTGVDGKLVARLRTTTLMLKTLRAGYVLATSE